MINIQIARNLLNTVSPKIREYWEKKNNASLARNIAEIEEIDKQKMVGDDRIGRCNKLIRTLIVLIPVELVILGTMALKYPHIQPVYPYTMLALFTFTLIVIICCQWYKDALNSKLSSYRFDKEQQQEILSIRVNIFWDTILKVCDKNTLPKTGLVDAEYLKGVMHGLIKDLLLKKVVLKSQHLNPDIGVENVAASAIAYTSADIYLDIQWKIVKDELGVEMDKKAMFKKVAEEMRITYPGLSEFFEVE